jgi:hypothetical protein
MTVIAARDDGFAEPSSEAETPKVRSTGAPAGGQASAIDHAPGSRTVEQPKAGGAAEPPGFEAATALPQVLKIVGTIVGPSTLLTALLFYFGLLFCVGYFHYFGVNFTVLDLSVQGYLVMSAASSIIPLIYAAGATLVALWLYQLPLERLSAGTLRTALRILAPSVAVTGLILVSLAMVDAISAVLVFPATFPEARGLSLTIGILLLAYAARLRRVLTAERRPAQVPRLVPEAVVVAKWGAVFILTSVGLFWAVGSYAVGAGVREAQGLAADLPAQSDVVLYSDKSQSLQGPGVHEATCQNPNAAYRFRYDGLKLVPQSGDHYLFLPAGWSPAEGAAILIPRSEATRLEFSPPGQVRNAAC